MAWLEEKLEERWNLAEERIRGICSEQDIPKEYQDYFRKVAEFILKLTNLSEMVAERRLDDFSLDQWQELNRNLYEDILPENYGKSYGNPDHAVTVLGDAYGRILSFLYTEIRGMIVFAFEKRWEDILILCELFIEVYNCFEEEELPGYRRIQQIIYWFISDYSDLTVTYRIREAVDPDLDFATKIITESDLSDLRYLYRYGEYVSENIVKTAKFLNSLSQKEIDDIASVYTEGYRIGFVLGNKDLSKKRTVNIRYILGFERIVRKAIENFAAMGLKPVIYRCASQSVNKRQHHRIGYYGAIPNQQYEYDHKDDNTIYLDRAFMERKLGVIRTAYEEYKVLANTHAGPAVIETFGEIPFSPVTKESAYFLSEKQQKYAVELANETAQITNRYIIGEERSFTIIAFPVPEIGDRFEEIFADTVKINTLDYKLYERIQQTLIDTLDQGDYVHIVGGGDNRTDLTVNLIDLNDPEKETIFENCVADVNIPVGEVFTSPKLKGTNGLLHVTEVFLEGLLYKDLAITFEDGMIKEYTCSNFEKEEDNKKYIQDNILFHHESLPMGEFAIGTNTTAYIMARKYQIQDKMPILIAEKTGPHFAVGDTCYSWSEDTPVYNPNGKEIVARDNEISILRKEDPGKAYFGCHTDITIPYSELGLLSVVKKSGEEIIIIRNGRFVLSGSEELNKPLDNNK